MAARGNSFGFKEPRKSNAKLDPFPIVGEFGGSVADSLYSSNKEASWNRWRRGYELATSNLAYAAFEYPFSYNIPLPLGNNTERRKILQLWRELSEDFRPRTKNWGCTGVDQFLQVA